MRKAFNVIIVVTLLLLIVMGIFLPFLININNSNSKTIREEFDDSGIVQSGYVANIYDKSGVERCEALYANLSERANMSTKALEVMDNYVLGLRLREWKPKDPIASSNYKPGYSYCYMYYDSNNDVVDPIIKDKFCDKTNSIFNNTPMVSSIFLDDQRDRTHSLPYQKCIVEIDPSKVTTSNLDKFWSSIGDQQCHSLYATSQSKTKDLKTIYQNSNNELNIFRTLEPQFNKQLLDNTKLNGTLNELNRNIRTSNCAFYGALSNQHKYTSSCNRNQEGSYNDNLRTISVLKTFNSQVTISINEVNKKTNDVVENMRKIERRIIELKGEIDKTEKAYERCIAIDLPNTIEAVQVLKHENVVLDAKIKAFEKALQTCSKKREPLPGILKTLEDFNIKLRDDTERVDGETIECNVKVTQLKKKIDFLQNELLKYQVLKDNCNANLQNLTVKYSNLVEERKNLTEERDEWERRCRGYQESWYNNIKQHVETKTREAVQDSKNVCGDSAQEADEVYKLIKEKAGLLRQIEEARNKEPFTKKECLQEVRKGQSVHFDKVMRECCKTL